MDGGVRDGDASKHSERVITAQAGIQTHYAQRRSFARISIGNWIPACAGMTALF
jgi:hypothetical protein